MADSPTDPTEFFDQLTNELLMLRVQAQRRYRPLSLEVLNQRPGTERWSVGQCFEHLNIVGGYYLPEIGARLRQAQAAGSQPVSSIKHGYFGQRKVLAAKSLAEEDRGLTHKLYAPTGMRLTRTVIEAFSRQLDELLRLMLLARQVNANNIRIPDPMFQLLRPAPDRYAWSTSWLTSSGTCGRPKPCWRAWTTKKRSKVPPLATEARRDAPGGFLRSVSFEHGRWGGVCNKLPCSIIQVFGMEQPHPLAPEKMLAAHFSKERDYLLIVVSRILNQV